MSFYVAQRLKFKQPLTSFTYSNASNMRPCAVALQLTKYEASRGPSRSTQPCIPPGSLNRVPASAGVRAGMSPLPGGR